MVSHTLQYNSLTKQTLFEGHEHILLVLQGNYEKFIGALELEQLTNTVGIKNLGSEPIGSNKGRKEIQ